MIQLYIVNCSPLLDEQPLAHILPHLTNDRRKKVEQLKPIEKKAQSAVAGLLLRHLFGEVEYTFGPHGKPYLKDDSRHFSLSHSDKWVVCAVSNAEIGVDIQSLSPIRPAVLRRCFTPEEQAWIGDDLGRFARLWTMKEAYIKLTGSGFSVAAKDIRPSVPPTAGYDNVLDCYWAFPEIPIHCSLCSKADKSIEITQIDVKDLL